MAATYMLSLTTQPACKSNQGLDAIKKQGAALSPEDMPVFSNILGRVHTTSVYV